MFTESVVLSLLALGFLLPGGGQEEAEAKRAVEDFTNRFKEAATPYEKARAVQALGSLELKDPLLVPPLAACLTPTPGDNFLFIPSAAAEALGSFRGVPAASRALMAALEPAKRVPFIHSRIYRAIGRVGHPSALALFDDALRSPDPIQASAALDAISEMPLAMALGKLFEEHDRMESARKKAKDNFLRVYDRCQPEIEKAVKRLSQAPYPTFPELKIWWGKHSAELRNAGSEKETGRAGGSTLLPMLLVELSFKEGGGTTTANGGASGLLYPSATVSSPKVTWTGTAAPNGGPAALEWDRGQGPLGVDLGGTPVNFEHLKGLKSFTLSGWFMCRDAREVTGGTKDIGGAVRLLSCQSANKLDGFDLVCRSDGSLQFGLNEWAESSIVRTPPARYHVYDTKEKDWGAELYRSWCFFAVTYDSTLSQGQAKIFMGWRGGDAGLVSTFDYPRGPIGPCLAPFLSVGNVPPDARTQAPGRNFHGIIDEIRIFGSPSDGSGALPQSEIVRVQNRGPG